MGMYSTIIEDKDIKVKKELGDNLYDGGNLFSFLCDGSEIKFYGYWTSDYFEFLNDVAKKGLVKGEIIVQHEDTSEPLILCHWDEDGFKYKYAKPTVFEDEWRKD